MMPQQPIFRPIVPKNPPVTVNRAKVIAGLKGFGVETLSKLSKYPAPPPGSTYRRTGEYGRRWNIKGPKPESALSGDIVVSVGILLIYAALVGGRRQTKRHKRTGWANTRDTAKQVWPSWTGVISDALQGK